MDFIFLLIQLVIFSFFVITSQKHQFSYTALYGTFLTVQNKSPFTQTDKGIMVLSDSTILLTTTNCSRQLSALSVVVYQLMGVVTAYPSGQTPNTSSKLDSPLNLQYHLPLKNSTGSAWQENKMPQSWRSKSRSNICIFRFNIFSPIFWPNNHCIFFKIVVIYFSNMNS